MSGATLPTRRHVASLETDSVDPRRGTWRCLCGWTRDVNDDHTAAEIEVENHVHGGPTP